MKIESTPVTGKEDKALLSAPLRAVSDFYTAFNNADLELMSKNWAQTDEAIRTTRWAASSAAGQKFDRCTTKYFGATPRCRWSFTTTRFTKRTACSTSFGGSAAVALGPRPARSEHPDQ